MKHVSILVPAGEAVLSSIVGPFKIFNGVNQYLINTGQRTDNFFDIHLVGLKKETNLYGGAFSIHPDTTIEEVEKTDLIIITTILGDIPAEIKRNYDFVPWIKKQRLQHGAEVASLCIGAFLFAETGLLDGKTCATHWSAAETFKQLHPQINLLTEKIITDDNGMYSSGGAYSFLNLILHLVDKYCGREAAIWAAKMFEIEIDREDQNQFMLFNGQKEHDDDEIKNAQLYIEANFGEKFNIEQLAKQFALSRRNFIRRFKKATHNTPLEYVQRVKIEAAKKMLESTKDSVSEIMFLVGYSDVKSFRNVFKKYAGLSPMAYKNKYNRSLVRQ